MVILVQGVQIPIVALANPSVIGSYESINTVTTKYNPVLTPKYNPVLTNNEYKVNVDHVLGLKQSQNGIEHG